MDPQLDTLIAEEHQEELQLPADQQAHRVLVHGFLTGFFDQVRPVILEELGKRQFARFVKSHYQRAILLSESLASGFPSVPRGSLQTRMHENGY